LGAVLTIQPRKKVIVRNPNRGGQGPNWAVELYDDDDTSVLKLDLISTILKLALALSLVV
jgi:hypothetical protein